MVASACRRIGGLLLPLALTGCAESPTDPDAPSPTLQRSWRSHTKCVTRAAAVVEDEAAFHAALAAASPGDVIAIRGTITVGADNATITTDGLTLGCAAPGAGITLSDGHRIDILANGITIEHLTIDATAGSPTPVVVFGSETLPCCADVRLTDNTVRGFRVTGVFVLRQVNNLVIARNRFEDADTAALAAIHIQGGASRGIITRNTVELPEGAFAGISVLDADRMTVSHNHVMGSPFAGLRLGTSHSVWAQNRVEGATGFGLLFEQPDRHENILVGNVITGSGAAGIVVRDACRNVFLGNRLSGNGDDVGALLDTTTGANVITGDRRLVVDEGIRDCDGDGTADPNWLAGGRLINRPLRLGDVLARLRSARAHPRIVVRLLGEDVELR